MKKTVFLFLILAAHFAAGQTYTVRNYNTMTVYVTIPPPFVPSSYKPFTLPPYQSPQSSTSILSRISSNPRELTASELALQEMKTSYEKGLYSNVISLSKKVNSSEQNSDYNGYLIRSYNKLGFIDKIAIEGFQREMKFDDIELYNTVGYALSINGAYSKAENYFVQGKAYEYNPKNPPLLYWYAYNRLMEEDYLPALKGYDKLIEVAYPDPTIYYLRAETYIRLYQTKTKSKGLLDNAIKDLDLSMTLLKNKTDALGMRAKAKYMKGDFQGCIEDAFEQMKTDTVISTLDMIGKSKMLLKDYKGSMDFYSFIVKMYPNAYEGYNGTGLIKCLQKDYKGALDDFEKSITLSFNRSNVPRVLYENKAFAHYLNGDYSLALIYLDPATGFDRNSFMSHFLKGNCLLKTGEISGEATESKTMKKLEPSKSNSPAPREATTRDEKVEESACYYLISTYEAMPSENPEYSLKDVDELIKNNCEVLNGWELLKNSKYGFNIYFPTHVTNPKNYYKDGEYFTADNGYSLSILKTNLNLNDNSEKYLSFYANVSEKIKFAGYDAYRFKYFSGDVPIEGILFQKDKLFFILQCTRGIVKSNTFFNSFTFIK